MDVKEEVPGTRNQETDETKHAVQNPLDKLENVLLKDGISSHDDDDFQADAPLNTSQSPMTINACGLSQNKVKKDDISSHDDDSDTLPGTGSV